MREIKFRGKCMFSNEWVYGDLIHKRHDRNALMIQDENGLGSDVVPESVGQFTGLRDKNSKEIYFGDIVRNKYGDIGKVVWFSDCSIRIDWGGGDIHFIDLDLELEVIGNIHDNPELLKSL